MSDFLRSDYCTQCDGKGWRTEKTFNGEILEKEQCESCEELHGKEVRSDRMFDELKELFI